MSFIEKLKDKLSNPEFEKERKSRLLKLVLTEIITLIVLYFGAKLFLFLDFNHHVLAAFLVIIYFGIVVFFFGNPFWVNKEFKQYLKDSCRKDIRKELKINMIKGGGFDEVDLKLSDLFATFNMVEFDDVIKGTYNDVPYKVAEAELVQQGRKNSITVFKGLILSFPANKENQSKTLITTKGDSNIRNYNPGIKYGIMVIIFTSFVLPLVIFVPFIVKFLPAIMENKEPFIKVLPMMFLGSLPGDLIILAILVYLIKLWWDKKKKLQDAKLEDVSFEKRFDIHTDDQVEARYLITPSFMERLQNLQTAFGTKNIKCSFYKDKIMFAIPTNRDLFELGSLYKPLGKGEDIEKFYNEINSIYEMIDHFKLDEKTGL